MAMITKKRKDTQVKRVFQHRIADVPGGVGIRISELGGDYLFEGTPLGAKGSDGLCSVVKLARVVKTVTTTATEIEVEKGHHFRVGDFVTSEVGAKAYAITGINKLMPDKDTITVSATLGVSLKVGAFIVEAEAEATGSTSKLKVRPQSLNGTGYEVTPSSNILADAWLIGVTQGNELHPDVAAELKGIINI